MLRGIAVAFAFVLLPAISWGGPFGFDVTAEPDPEHCKTLADTPLMYRCDTAPNLHPDFEVVVIKYHPDLGFCFLKGIGRETEDNSFGSRTKIKHEKISDQVSSVYGQPSRQIDTLLNGSIWDEPEDYMMALLRNERYRITVWETDATRHTFNKIGVMSNALNVDIGYVNIEYYFPTNDDCNKKIDENAASSF